MEWINDCGLYGDQHRALQDEFGTRPLADRVRENIVTEEMGPEHFGFIESRDMFFLSSIDHRGFPTCSYKGGYKGFVRALDTKTLVFPSFDGNGMFLSMGNINANGKIGMLFIDFETPHRVRVHGKASVSRDDILIKEFPGAQLVVRIDIAEIFVNCPRYIHQYQRVSSSKYIPQEDCSTPLPAWKRIDSLQPVLPPHDKQKAAELGIITAEEYVELLMLGKG